MPRPVQFIQGIPVSPLRRSTPSADSLQQPGPAPSLPTADALPAAANTGRLAKKPRVGPIESQLRMSVAERTRKIESKGYPRVSKSGYESVNLNCQIPLIASFSATSEGTHGVVSCRHFAFAFAKHQGKKRDVLKVISSSMGFKDQFEGGLTTMDREFYEILRCSPQACKHVVESNQFGSCLTALATGLEAAAQRGEFVDSMVEINCLLVTENHAMALHMEKKAKDGVAYFVTKLYEPNETLNYKRVEQLTPAGFGAVKLGDMLSISDYRPPTLVAVCLDGRVHLEIDRGTLSPTPENMLVALSNGAADAVCAMVDTQRRMPNWSPDALAQLFWHRSSSGRTGLNLAFCHGYTETVSSVTRTLLGSGLPHDQIVNLLACCCPFGHHAFSMAFDLGHASTIEAFTLIVLASEKLHDDAKLWLLQARAPEGWSGLQLAMHMGQEDAAHAFLNAVEAAPNLSSEMQTRLLDW